MPVNTSTTLLSTTTTIFKTSVSPSVSSISLDPPVPLRVLAIRPNSPSLAVLDYSERTTTVYPPGAHALPGDATDGVWRVHLTESFTTFDLQTENPLTEPTPHRVPLGPSPGRSGFSNGFDKEDRTHQVVGHTHLEPVCLND